MKKKIIIGSLLSVFILMMLPSASSLQFNTASETNKSRLLEKTKNIDIRELIEKHEDDSSPLLFGDILRILIRIIGMLLTTTIIAFIIYLYVSSLIGPPPK